MSLTVEELERLRTENEQMKKALHAAEQRRALLDHIGAHLQQTLRLEDLIPRLFIEVNAALRAEAQSLWLADHLNQRVTCRFATGPGAEQVQGLSLHLTEGIVGATIMRQQSLLIHDAQLDIRHSRLADERTGRVTHSLLSVPLVRGGTVIGAMQAINKQESPVFEHADLELYRAIADVAALALENALLYTQLESSYNATLEVLSTALDQRDHETEGHSQRVSEFTVRLAQEIGLPLEEQRFLRRASLLHDIGKIGIPDAILNKPGPLTQDERRVMQRHPQLGFEMLQGIPHLHRERELVLTHQERWDGKGYPNGLRGEAIPLSARIFAIADTFDAILSDRPYRKGRDYATARAIIASEIGQQFEPRLVEAFMRIPEQEWIEIRKHADLLEEPLPTPELLKKAA
ncbi:HD-GYP domain-containing protein [Armatimonas rosea]|uniref:HD-GYP domain-containing protein (C-di-GMP phosphodiesterase class II) n=1 Tax=Armatimonas rosea TaxID=685828 RepID=A0A7W9W6M4_ARMRO|nr:HD domain-containing phosphohydrolase [Armatimonas rosea]MBB6050326.1 HD-GYP domain-containing protein (c-di-GMP phosphodiesterase class II) [Armatimonas rosea]